MPTSSALKITYNLIVSCPRIEWYILLASVSGLRITIDITRRKALRMSAFWDGGNGVDFNVRVLNMRRPSARTERIGSMVKV